MDGLGGVNVGLIICEVCEEYCVEIFFVYTFLTKKNSFVDHYSYLIICVGTKIKLKIEIISNIIFISELLLLCGNRLGTTFAALY